MKPENEDIEEFKMKCFKFSLTDFATVWYYSSNVSCAGYNENLRARFLNEFSPPPSLRHDTRERIIRLQQSRDETLDEYYTYYDTIVSRCPHHGFTEVFLLQKFLCGMRQDEFSRINDAVGGTTSHLTITQMWDTIDDLAEATKRRPTPRANRGIQIVEAGPETDKEETSEPSEETPEPSEETPEPSEESDIESTGSNEEKPSWELETVPAEEEVQNTTDKLPESYPTIITKVAETIQDRILTDKHNETEPSFKIQASRLFPLVNRQVAENYVINEETKRRMGKGPKQNESSMEHFFATTRQGSPKRKKTIFKRLVVKGPSPSQRHWKEKPPEQWEQDPNSSSHKTSGRIKARINAGAAAKFDLSRPWDPNW
ncbi:unnamed protein product [Rhodiola kirilowii]